MSAKEDFFSTQRAWPVDGSEGTQLAVRGKGIGGFDQDFFSLSF